MMYERGVLEASNDITFRGNSALRAHGGGVYMLYMPVAVVKNKVLFDKNRAGLDAGAMYLWADGNITIADDVTFKGCTSGRDAGALYIIDFLSRSERIHAVKHGVLFEANQCGLNRGTFFQAYGYGGGLFIADARVELENAVCSNEPQMQKHSRQTPVWMPCFRLLKLKLAVI